MKNIFLVALSLVSASAFAVSMGFVKPTGDYIELTCSSTTRRPGVRVDLYRNEADQAVQLVLSGGRTSSTYKPVREISGNGAGAGVQFVVKTQTGTMTLQTNNTNSPLPGGGRRGVLITKTNGSSGITNQTEMVCNRVAY